MRHMQAVSRADARRGVILMIVLALLTLFAILGLSFVLYANSQAKSSDLALQAQVDANGGNAADISPDTLGNSLLDVFIYGQDDKTGIYSAYRGHDFARSVYGGNYTVDAQGNVSYMNGVTPINNIPFNGTGRLHETINFVVGGAPVPIDGYSLVNYMCYLDAKGNFVDQFMNSLNQPIGGLRDPERLGVRTSTSLTSGSQYITPTTTLSALTAYSGGFNVSWTYPDLNNMYLAAVRADGAVLMPSFHRPWLTNPLDPNSGFGPIDPTNPNWYDPAKPWLKYQVLRPRPVDQLLANEVWQVNPNTGFAPTRLDKAQPYNTVTKTYRTSFFPPPANAGGDVKNLAVSPGTLLPSNQFANNDSFWMDFGFPVMTTRDGKKYKPMAAILMTDLDNRVNLNVHGNVRGVDPNNVTLPNAPMHVSNQGWGPWEVNLSQVMNTELLAAPTPAATAPPLSTAQEWIQVLKNSTFGRYGPDSSPGTLNAVAGRPPAGRFYSPTDLDARNSANSGPSNPLALPGTSPTAPPNFPFPFFQPSSYGSGDSVQMVFGTGDSYELSNNPSLNGYLTRTGDDRQFSISEMDALLRYGDVGSGSLQSQLMLLCPKNFGTGLGANRIRNLVSVLSMDLDRPGAAPWARTPASGDPNANAAAYQFNPNANPYPTGNAMATPQFPASTAWINSSPTQSQQFEYGTDGRSLAAALGRVNLNRPLTDYPAPVGGQINPNDPQLALAVADRQALATDIYDRFRLVTMGEAPSFVPLAPGGGAIDPAFEARRWLAQLAANIVDYLDNDDYMTPFNWYTVPPAQLVGPGQPIAGTKYYVFGTELPRVVLNEAYAEFANTVAHGAIPQDLAGNSSYDVNFWVELLNTYANDPSRNDNGDAYLQVGATPVYQLALLQNPNNGTADLGGTPGFNRPDNTLGDPVTLPLSSPPNTPTPIGNANIVMNAWGAGNVVLPANNKQPGPTGYFVVGPQAGIDFQGGGGTFTPSYQSASMSLTVPTKPLTAPQTPPTTNYYGVYLQRLACTSLPYQNVPGSANYNPYVTVDYIPSLSPNYAFNQIGGVGAPPAMNQPLASRASQGRNQPYAAFVPTAPAIGISQMKAQTTPHAGQPNNTFLMGNDNGLPAFDWLAHLDRPVISPVELFQTSMFKPHQLTQNFIDPTGKKFNHRLQVGLIDQTSRLYRGFEFLTVQGRGAGMAANGRVPGKINLNTIWDPETLLALVDPQPANAFYQAPPTPYSNSTNASDPAVPFWQLYSKFYAARTKGPNGTPSGQDAPFKGLATPYVTGASADPQYPNGTGIADTIFRLGIWDVVTPHPVQQTELLNKIYNNVTTRSNVFAIWMTVGFFEVIDDTTRPVKLGGEIGAAQYQNIRHRMFAIIDRTNLRSQQSPLVFLKANGAPVPVPSPPAPPGTFDVAVDTLSGNYEGNPFNIQPGAQLLVDVIPPNALPAAWPTPNQEIVSVISVNALANPPTFRAQFTKPHSAGFLISPANSYIGNPGPQQGYNALQDSTVVRYFNVIN